MIIYDLRFTIYDLQIVRSEAAATTKQMRTRIRKAVIGRGYKETVALGGAYDDVAKPWTRLCMIPSLSNHVRTRFHDSPPAPASHPREPEESQISKS